MKTMKPIWNKVLAYITIHTHIGIKLLFWKLNYTVQVWTYMYFYLSNMQNTTKMAVSSLHFKYFILESPKKAYFHFKSTYIHWLLNTYIHVLLSLWQNIENKVVMIDSDITSLQLIINNSAIIYNGIYTCTHTWAKNYIDITY